MKHLLLMLGLLVCSWALAAAPMDETAFTKAFVQRAGPALKGHTMQVVKPLQLAIKAPDGTDISVFLDNAYAQYKADTTRLPDVLDSQIAGIQSQARFFAGGDTQSILAVVKSGEYLEGARKQLSKAGASAKDFAFVHEEIGDDLFAVFVFDSEEGMRPLTNADLTNKKLDMPALRATAKRNLEKYFDKHKLSVRRLEQTGSAKVYAVSLDENYEASILLVEKYWTKKTFDVPGKLIAYVPARNVVLVVGSDDKDAIAIASHVASRGYQELGYSISPNGFMYEGGKWKLFKQH